MSSVSLVKVLKHGLKKYKEPQDFLEFLTRFQEKKSIKLIGNGYFSKVFEHPEIPNRVIKISGAKNVAKDGAVEYCYWIWKNKIQMPGIPIIHNIVKYNNYYYVEMENHGISLMDRPNDKYNTVKDALSQILLYGTIRYNVDSEDSYETYKEYFLPYVDSIVAIRREFYDRFYADLHSGNITVDSNDKLWFIDPIGFSC